MNIILSLLDTNPAPFWPISIIGWLGWLVFLGLIIWLVWMGRHLQLDWNMRNWNILGFLSIFVILSNLFIGVRLPVGSALSLPGVPQEPRGLALMLLSMVPILLGGGILGPIAAALLGLLAGIIRYLWDTNSIFTINELVLLGVLFSFAIRQRYRTRTFRLLREPLIAAIFLALIYVPVFIIDAFLAASDTLPARMDYALAGVAAASLARAGELIIAGMFAQVLALAFPQPWGRKLPLQPSPAQRSLEARFFLGTGAIIITLLFALLAGDWFIAGTVAQDLLRNRLESTAQLSSENVPFLLETGQNLALQTSQKPEMLTAQGSALAEILGQEIRAIPYFDQMLVFDHSKQFIAAYPSTSDSQLSLFPEENAAIDLAFNGVISQHYTIPALQQAQAARISFITAIIDQASGQTQRVIIARTNLAANPLAQPLITSLKSISAIGGSGILLDENGRIIYSPVFSQIITLYSGQIKTQPTFFEDTAPNGTRSLVYYQPVPGRSWAIVLTIPAQQAQQTALTIATPLSVLILVLTIIALISLRLGLKGITTSLHTLANESVRIAQGQFDHALTTDGVDEVGQLRRAFEQMRVSLQSRLEELNRLLLVSQGVASSLDIQEALQPVMEAVLATGASAVRLVIPPLDEFDQLGQPSVYALGPRKDAYAHLDDQLLTLAHQKNPIIITSVSRLSIFEPKSGSLLPFSIMALPLRHEHRSIGVLWAGYDQEHPFSETDIRFLTTLASQASLAASNHHLFRSAEVGRQRLAAILESTPDPIIVTDQFNRLILANPAAWQILATAPALAGPNPPGKNEGQPIQHILQHQGLLDILVSKSPEKLSAEITQPDGRVYFATASPMLANDLPVGRVCILRDVTHFKELDTMKTEFVNTVSHDLRSPLTLIRGYATMLDLVGAINEQQQSYVRQIVSGVENMARLVNNLLDLGRIEAGVGLQLEIFPLFDILERAIGPLQRLASQKNIEFTITAPKNTVPLIEADQALLQQAIHNLIENAIKYTPPQGRVAVRLTITQATFLLEVQDTGIGIAPIDQPRLFEKFFRAAQRETREQKGSGLGLAIVKSIIDRHGGKVWLESQLGKGTTFSLQMPLRQPKITRT